ncbi:NAD(P)-dependent alcohol dehydrogenase [Streptomyces sp. NBC_01373]|uniref:NAD(P)-dependent alcohol dehydrogenase n=1 Tax=Streptomyces sp. NBC_01373 TaxID=2903843 RepID=UPI00224DB619|nr:NAD(P)-dependent alcohol dehydrogenase [Streptomyces sp. NBC_01373]MCX4706533.1 NAD(P)-dependent alcohol dehydrogenase [Streptomyces sp. NBC_01373]
MQAVRLTEWGREPTLAELERPVPRGTEVLVRVDAAGLCQSDVHVIDAAEGALPYRPPFTLGHEVAGHVAALGPDAEGTAAGERVVVYGPWGCGNCTRCAAGRDNYCDRRGDLGWHGVGLGRDGGMAGYLLVPSARHLVPIGDLSAAQAAPLSDAGLTSYHALAGVRHALGEGTVALVIGVGGLGHLAVQMVRATTPSRVLAVDIREEAVDLALRSGAHLGVPMGADTAKVLRAETAGVGVDAVLDFVGNEATFALAVDLLRPGGELAVVGSGGGRLTVRKPGFLPAGFRLSLPFWGTRPELAEVIALARAGSLHVETEQFPLSAAPEALGRLRQGRVRGRAVLLPD